MVSKLYQVALKCCPCSSKVVPSRLNLCYHVATRCVEGVPIQQKVQKWSSLAIFRVFLLAEFLWCSFSLTSSGMKGLQRRYLQLNWSKIFVFVVHSIASQAQSDPWTLIEEREHLVLQEKCNILPSVVEPATGVARINGFCALHITWIQSFWLRPDFNKRICKENGTTSNEF